MTTADAAKLLQSPQLPILKWWWVAAAALCGAIMTVLFMWWLLGNIATQPDPRIASTQLDAIRTALTLAVGTGGGLALWLAARRQRSTELQLLETSRIAAENKSHLERVALSTEFDLRERRITDIYSKAVEQLGNDKAPVRLGGLYALERLAQENPSHRQTVTNVICAYLKMPFTEPKGSLRYGRTSRPTNSQEELIGLAELQTRLVAQEILIRNLRVHGSDLASPNERGPWERIDLDLSGAVLVDFRLINCTVRKAAFNQTRFIDVARFDDTIFEEDVWFFYSIFDAANAFFCKARFNGRAIFTGADFGLHVDFAETQFAKEVSFFRSVFRSLSSFKDASFKSCFSFESCRMQEIIEPGIDKESFGPPRFDFSGTTVDKVEGAPQELPSGWMLSEVSDGSKRRVLSRKRSEPSGEA
jgi:hypothetical protein